MTGISEAINSDVAKHLPKDVNYGKSTIVASAKPSFIGVGETKKVTAEFFQPLDGDTARIYNKDKFGDSLLCRFQGIDAPEINHGKARSGQPYGEESLKNLQNMVKNKEVEVSVRTGKDKYGRDICQISVEGKSVNLEQVKGGYAWLYEQFAPPELINQYRSAQKKAVSEKLGLWSDPIPTAPWDWRQAMWPKK